MKKKLETEARELRLKVQKLEELVELLKSENKNLKENFGNTTKPDGGDDGGEVGCQSDDSDAMRRKRARTSEIQKEKEQHQDKLLILDINGLLANIVTTNDLRSGPVPYKPDSEFGKGKGTRFGKHFFTSTTNLFTFLNTRI